MAVDLNILTAEDARNLLVLLKRTPTTGTDEARVLIVLEEKIKRIHNYAAIDEHNAKEEEDGEDTPATDE